MHSDHVVAIRVLGTDDYLYEDDAGEVGAGPLGARTFLFDPDEEALHSHMSAAPGGHQAVEEVHFTRTMTPIA